MTMMRYTWTLLLAMLLLGVGCKNKNDRSFNIFTIEDDKALGLQVKNEIASDQATYPILSETQYPGAYAYLRSLRDEILSSPEINYRDEFAWELYIINDPNTLNAFAAPGGYIYVYTGLIKFLDSEDQLAGVLAHEIAHADRRHSTDQLTKAYGVGTLVSILLGNDHNMYAEIAQSLLTLEFSRSAERDADEYSVVYLCPTDLNAAGAAAFFTKMQSLGTGGPPTFLSTHPSDASRISNINEDKSELGCTGTATNNSEYAAFKASLP